MILNTYYRVLSVFRRSCYFAVSKKQKRMLKNILLVTAVAATLFSCKKEGCMDETAINYNSEAKNEDGSCKYETAEGYTVRSEEHTSELQSRPHLVCRLL